MLVNICDHERGKLGFVYVNPREAIGIIRSLSNQLLARSPNAGRLESRCEGGLSELTIAVTGMESGNINVS
jgi:hypothetical protein